MNDSQELKVIKRNGKIEEISFDKILKRVKNLGIEFNLHIPYSQIVLKVIDQLYNNISTSLIDELTAEQCTAMSTKHPDYSILASAIVISNLHKNTEASFYKSMKKLYEFCDNNHKKAPIINSQYMNIIKNNKEFLDSIIDYKRDFLIDYFGFKTLERAYLLKINKKTIERPQHMWLRTAICIHGNNMEKVKESYDLMSQKYFTHATPTLYNAGTLRQQLSSCYLIAMEDDSIDGIYNTLKDCAKISKWAGGIGLHIHNIRAEGSYIRGTSGISNGIVPMLSVFNKTARYVDQGGGKRNGSFAIYIEPHHADIEAFLDLKKNHGDEELRSRDLFYALWISDLFMERVMNNEIWSLFCPDTAPGLSEIYGDKFKELYCQYEKENKFIKQINARDLWVKILDSQMETGTPYLLFKDACNKKSNQKNLGTIKSSNLCTEIIEYSDINETAVCNLASIGLSKFITDTPSPFTNVKLYSYENSEESLLIKGLFKRKKITYEEIIISNNDSEKILEKLNIKNLPYIFDNDVPIGGYKYCLELLRSSFNYDKLYEVTKIITDNLNKIIDINFYPTEKTKRSNIRHRPIGIGVQGLADVFILMDYPFESQEAKEINKNIFETIYYASLEKSNEIAIERCENFNYLLNEYHAGNWNFKDSSDICTEYKIYNKTCASSSEVKKIDEKTKELLEKIRPIRDEINLKDISNNLRGAYSSFVGSPSSNGILQFDLWNVEPSKRYDWNKLKKNIINHGLRNSLLVAPMPTASTSQILGNNECIEPITSNIYSRRTLAGDHILINKYLIKELIDLDIWSEEIKNNIIVNKGSVQYIDILPQIIKDKHKIVWEISMKNLVDMARDRGAYICQSQSLNLWKEDPDIKTLTNMHFYSWKAGLKTGIYYLRRKPKHQPQQFTIEPEKKIQSDKSDEPCEMCSG